ncbi:MAG: hypothetical protein IJJ69_00530 [Oscillospiraceae bacterium]|nr:hypothetical protein [Oscillospiraceae bacterium]
MQMTNEEICQSYQQAKQKAKQIQILAELNACQKAEIIAVLEESGVQVGVRAKKTLEEQSDYKPVYKKSEPVVISWQNTLKAVVEHIAELKHQKEAIEAELAEIYRTLGEICGKDDNT